MDSVLQASPIDQCPHFRKKEKEKKKEREKPEKILLAIALCMGGHAVARTGVLPMGGGGQGRARDVSSPRGPQPPRTHVRSCHWEQQQEREHTSFLESSGKTRVRGRH